VSDDFNKLVKVTEYTVSLLPDDHIDAGAFEIRVQYRGRGLWGVCRMRQCLGADGQWDWESIPSERGDEWLKAHRFELQDALRRALDAAPSVTVNGRTAAEALARGAS